MNRCHHRHLEFAKKDQEVLAGFAAEYAVFVLEEHPVDTACIKEFGDPPVVVRAVLSYPPLDFRRVGADGFFVVQRGNGEVDVGGLAGQCRSQVAGERRDPTLARGIASDDGDAP